MAKLIYKDISDESPYENPAMKREKTRSFIVNVFVIGYLIIIAGLILLSTWGGLKVDVVKDFLLAVGSPLGFIISFYFSSREDKE